MPSRYENPELYDVILLGGVASPGEVTLSGHKREEGWDVKEADGKSGASTEIKGHKLAKFTASFYLVRDVAQGIDDFAAWDEFVKIINGTTSGKSPSAVDVYHPDLAELDPPISSVVKGTVGGKVPDGKGGATVVVEFLEYKPPKPKSGSPSGSKSKKQPDPNDPNADVKKEIQATLDEAKAL